MVIGLPRKGKEWEPILQEFRRRMKRAGILGMYALWGISLVIIIFTAWSHRIPRKEGVIIQWNPHKESQRPVFSVGE